MSRCWLVTTGRAWRHTHRSSIRKGIQGRYVPTGDQWPVAPGVLRADGGYLTSRACQSARASQAAPGRDGEAALLQDKSLLN